MFPTAPELKDWAGHNRAVLADWYRKIVAMLPAQVSLHHPVQHHHQNP